jgi:hypothetical protein
MDAGLVYLDEADADLAARQAVHFGIVDTDTVLVRSGCFRSRQNLE